MFNPNRTILAGVPVATLQLWLGQAQTAYAALVTGGKAQSLSYDGKSVTYSQANRGDLESWISLLQRQLGVNHGRRALRPYFR